MLRSILRLCVALLWLSSTPAWALTGPETALQLNQRLAATPAQCVGGKPPYACSGVLALAMAEDHPQPFWHHGAAAEGRGAERFVFLRRDQATLPPPGRVGYIFHDSFTATGQGKPYEVIVDGGAAPGEVDVRNWAEDEPDRLALQALYYDAAEPDGLLRAQRGQREYFEATGQWLPLLRFSTAEGAGSFGFSQQEQLYNGYQVAARLNARYARTGSRCADGRAAFFCNGVIVRTTDVGDFHAWDTSPSSIKSNGVSFLYFRADIRTRLYKPQGFVFSESSRPVVYPVTLRCLFPYDGYTGSRDDACDFRPSCASLGVTSVDAWKARYLSKPHDSCYFASTVEEFQLALEVHTHSGAADSFGYSELVMANWPQGIGTDLPLEGFVHGPAVKEGDGLPGAMHFQLDYYRTTRRYLPVMEVVANAPDGQVFVFKPEEQNVQ